MVKRKATWAHHEKWREKITLILKQIHQVSNIFQIQPKVIKTVTWLSFIQTLCQYLNGFGQRNREMAQIMRWRSDLEQNHFLIKKLINANFLYGTVDQWEKLTPKVHLWDFDLYVAESRFKNKRRTLTDISPKSTRNVLFVKFWSKSTDEESMLHRRNFFGQEFHTELKIPQRRCKINITDFLKTRLKGNYFEFISEMTSK